MKPMGNITALDPEPSEAEQFLRTPDAYRVLSQEIITRKEEGGRQGRAAAPTYDRVIEAVLAGEEPLEVVTRPLAGLGQQWMVTVKNLPHLAVYVSASRSECETVALTRQLVVGD
jgi:hypothetical protein